MVAFRIASKKFEFKRDSVLWFTYYIPVRYKLQKRYYQVRQIQYEYEQILIVDNKSRSQG